jgi:allantoin racemase
VREFDLRIHIVNPNTTATMTQGIAAVAKAAAPAGVEIVASEPESGFDRGTL